MKKHQSGFIPIPFKAGGKILIRVSAIGLVITGVDNLAGWGLIPGFVMVLSIGLFLISLYMVYVIPES